MTGPRLIPLELQLVAVAALLGLLAWTAHLARRGRLALRDALLFVPSTAAALVLLAFPGLLRAVARLLDVEVPANALFGLAFLYVLANLLAAATAASSGAARTRRLAQECALLRGELELLRARVEAAERGGEGGHSARTRAAPDAARSGASSRARSRRSSRRTRRG